jgi:hypothetical protein
MASPTCSTHPGAAAAFRCEACGSLLCDACTQKSHALFLCRLCGERALPLGAAAPATVREHEKRRRIERPYSIGQAFFYPFRGMGLYLFIAALVSMAVVELVLRVGFGCLPIVIAFLFWTLMVGIQFKIVDTTAQGDDELPDWPNYLSFSERIPDVLAYVGIAALQFGPLAAYAYLVGFERLIGGEPNLLVWIGVAFFAWCGTALATTALAAAGRFGPGAAIRVDLHGRAFLAAGRDALIVADVTFVLGIAFWIVRSLLAAVPIAGGAVAGTLGAYWLFTSAHLAGLLVRRHAAAFEAIYD